MGRFFQGIGQGLVAYAERRGRIDQINRLNAKTDEELQAMGLTRDEVFICNILKCRPPNNRDPAPDEISSCWPPCPRHYWSMP